MLTTLTDFLIAIALIWWLCLASILITNIRHESPMDADVADDWQDLRTAIRLTRRTLTDKWRNR